MTHLLSLLLGLTQTSATSLSLLVGVYFALPAYTAFGNSARKGDCQTIQHWQVFVLPSIAFVVFWLCGRPIWIVLLWLWGGDLYAESANVVSVIFALFFSGMLLTRLATKWVSRSYLQINAWGIGLAALLLGAMYLLEIANRIDGWTTHGAAEKEFAYLMKPSKFYPGHLPRWTVDETTQEIAAREGKGFALYIDDKLAAEVHVYPHCHWWWAIGSFHTTPFASENLNTQERIERFKELLNE